VPHLEYFFSDFERELTAIGQIAAEYIRHDSGHVIPRLIEGLKNIASSDDRRSYPWNIPVSSPLRTKSSRGQYEPDSQGGRSIFGEVTSTWDIQTIRDRGSPHGPAKKLALVGKASTRIRIIGELADGELEQLAMWRMEIGGVGAPGACFHIQVLGEETLPPFPKDLPIPRLPTVMFTPMLAFDFLLGELFQDEWTEHVSSSKDRGALEIWRGIQTRRLKNLLAWQLEGLDNVAAVPWTWIKKLEPPADLFTR
jgi:hypothetical protein